MKKSFLYLLPFALFVFTCGPATEGEAGMPVSSAQAGEEAPKAPPLIDTVGTFIPGKSLGNITLGENSVSAFEGLDSLAYSTATPGQSTNTYVIDDNGREANLNVVTVLDSNSMNTQRVSAVRTTAAKYKDEQGMGAGSLLGNLRKTYELRPLATFSEEGIPATLYGSELGVYFEVRQDSICRAVAIAPAGEQISALYQNLFKNYVPVD